MARHKASPDGLLHVLVMGMHVLPHGSLLVQVMPQGAPEAPVDEEEFRSDMRPKSVTSHNLAVSRRRPARCQIRCREKPDIAASFFMDSQFFPATFGRS